MSVRSLLFVIPLFLVAPRSYAENEALWLINPIECVVSDEQEYCETTLVIELMKETRLSSSEQPCVYVDNQWIGCFDENKDELRYPTIIKSDLVVRLQNTNRQILAQTTIDYRVLKSKSQRRRVRLPWSIL